LSTINDMLNEDGSLASATFNKWHAYILIYSLSK
jgi:hypothetical protein